MFPGPCARWTSALASACRSAKVCSSEVLFSSKSIPSARATAARVAYVACSPPSRSILWTVGSETPLRSASIWQLIRSALRLRCICAAIPDCDRLVAAMIPSEDRIVKIAHGIASYKVMVTQLSISQYVQMSILLISYLIYSCHNQLHSIALEHHEWFLAPFFSRRPGSENWLGPKTNKGVGSLCL